MQSAKAKGSKASRSKAVKPPEAVITSGDKLGVGDEVIWTPQPRQARALACPAEELFFGGAAGGGKSDLLLAAFTRGLHYGSHYKGVIFRRSYKELEELVERSHELYRPLGGNYLSTVRTWQFPGKDGNGATLKFRFLENDMDVHDYQGHQYQYIGWDELTLWATDYCYVYLLSRLRSPHGIPCRVVGAGNPGGPGHQWVKRRFIDPSEPDRVFMVRETMNKVLIESTRCFIPSKLEDNIILMSNDPRYEQRLALLPPNLYRALREGDWNVFEGQAFSEFIVDDHVVDPFPLDPNWYRFCSMDWGYAKPFSIGWWAVTGDGRMIRYREWYGSDTAENKGVEMPAVEVAKKAMEMSIADGVEVMVADPACWSNQGTGTTIAEVFTQCGWQMEKAVNDRMNGLAAVHNKLKSKGEDGRPQMLIFDSCTDTIRTLPMLPYDPKHPEDIDCLVAGTKVSTLLGDKNIEHVLVGDMVATPIGFRAVTESYDSGESETILVEFDGGSIEGTPHHKVYVEGKGLVELCNLQCHDILTQRSTAWGNGALYTAVLLTQGILDGCITFLTGAFCLMVGCLSIVKYGLMKSARFLKSIISIILTATTTIMKSLTSRVSRQGSIVESTFKKGSKESLGKSSKHGERAPMGKRPSEKTLTRCKKGHRRNEWRAGIVALSLLRDTLRKSIAAVSAKMWLALNRSERIALYAAKSSGRNIMPKKRPKRVRIRAVGPSERKHVYNLTVKGAHLFYANSILSANTTAEDHCISGDTQVCTPDGLVRIGDLVGKTGKIETADGISDFHSCRMTRKDADMVEVVLSNGKSVKCTPDHLFLSSDLEWIPAEALQGMELYTKHDVLTVVEVRPSKREDVYNLEVDKTHCFVVDGGAVVHNCYDDIRYAAMSRLAGQTYSVRRYRNHKERDQGSVYKWLEKTGTWG